MSRSVSRPSPPGVRGRVLVVDDEDVIASTLQEFLQGEGFEVGVAGNADAALAVSETLDPEVALLDVQLIEVMIGEGFLI